MSNSIAEALMCLQLCFFCHLHSLYYQLRTCVSAVLCPITIYNAGEIEERKTEICKSSSMLHFLFRNSWKRWQMMLSHSEVFLYIFFSGGGDRSKIGRHEEFYQLLWSFFLMLSSKYNWSIPAVECSKRFWF